MELLDAAKFVKQTLYNVFFNYEKNSPLDDKGKTFEQRREDFQKTEKNE